MNIREATMTLEFRKIIFLLITLVFTCFSWIVLNNRHFEKNYSIFITFDTNHGIEKGTSIRIKGLTVGSVCKILKQADSIVAIAHINTSIGNIHQDSIVETNHSGLFSETTIDIVPLDTTLYNSYNRIDPFDSECPKSSNLCHLSSIEGERGFDYDDLIRVTTRILQRLDAPRHTKLSYLFWQPGMLSFRDILKITAASTS